MSRQDCVLQSLISKKLGNTNFIMKNGNPLSSIAKCNARTPNVKIDDCVKLKEAIPKYLVKTKTATYFSANFKSLINNVFQSHIHSWGFLRIPCQQQDSVRMP